MRPTNEYAMSTGARAVIWVPALVFALLYSAFFLALSTSTVNPKLWRDAKSLLLLRGLRRRRRRGGATAGANGLTRAGASDASLASSGAASSDAKAGAGDVKLRLTRAPLPVVLSWEGVGCAYKSPEGLKPVLIDVTGEARPGEMSALMGPSGSGKSTLLDMLAGRKTVGHLAGAVRVNGRPRGSRFRFISSYVPQDDNLVPQMTVLETCQLFSAFTLPRGTPRAVAAERIDEVLCAMGMEHARKRLVGGVLPGGLLLRGLSGGERKRLWVAVGILATPSVVFLDGARGSGRGGGRLLSCCCVFVCFS